MVEPPGQVIPTFQWAWTIPSSGRGQIYHMSREKRVIDREFLCYLAGFIDGEGSVSLNQPRDRRRRFRFRDPSVEVSSTSLCILEDFRAALGGCVCKHKKYKEHHAQAYSWRVSGRKALHLLGLIAPLLRVPKKKARAIYLTENYLRVTPRNGKYNEESIKAKQDFEQGFFELS